MKKIILIFTVCLFLFIVIPAQDTTSYPKYALSFGIDDSFTLNEFDMDFAIKQVVNNTHQMRLFLSPRVNTDFEETESEESTNTEIEDVEYSLGFGIDFIWIISRNNNFELYGGSGMVMGYGLTRRETVINYTGGNMSKTEIRTPSVEAGIRCIFGTEWRISDEIGVHGEYLFTLLYNWQKRTQKEDPYYDDNIQTTLTTLKSLSLTSKVLFGLSIYF